MIWFFILLILTIFIIFPIIFLCYLGWITLLPVSHWEISFFSYIHPFFMKLLSFTNLTKHFKVKFINEQSIDSEKQYLYCLHPHGMITISKLLHFLDIKSPLYKYWKDTKNAAHSGLFMVPLVRELILLFRCVPVSKSYLQYYINSGYSITLNPGGIDEIKFSQENLENDYIYLKNRKGFIKLSEKNNVPIIPIYLWNEQNIFTHKSHFTLLSKIISRIIGHRVNLDIIQIFTWENLYKLLKIIMGENEPNTTLYVGEPFFINPEESVESAHNRYIKTLESLYEYARKDQDSQRQLVIK